MKENRFQLTILWETIATSATKYFYMFIQLWHIALITIKIIQNGQQEDIIVLFAIYYPMK